MGHDHGTKRPHQRTKARTEVKTNDPYIRLLVKLYRFLAQRTGTKFAKTILRRLFTSRINRPPLSLSRLARCVARHVP